MQTLKDSKIAILIIDKVFKVNLMFLWTHLKIYVRIRYKLNEIYI